MIMNKLKKDAEKCTFEKYSTNILSLIGGNAYVYVYGLNNICKICTHKKIFALFKICMYTRGHGSGAEK